MANEQNSSNTISLKEAQTDMHHALGGIEKSARQIREHLKSMTESSKKVKTISRTLKDISVKSRMLALNAAIEATRAGEVGKSFTIVADEFAALSRLIEQAAQQAEEAMTESDATASHGSKVSAEIEVNLNTLIQKQQAVEQLVQGRLIFDPATMSTGVASIDQQHQKLFDMVNDLSDAVARGAGKDQIKSTLDFLAEYVVEHFGHEEGVMAKHHCPSGEQNIQAHRRLLDFYAKWRAEFDEKGSSISMVANLQRILKDWLVSHIGKIDTCLKPCVNKNLGH